jgi:tetratricopeptide (TPR) repeat protein
MKPLYSSIFAMLFVTCFSVVALAQNPNPGPRSQAAADLLWTEAQGHLNQQKYEPAIAKLKPFTDLYPSDARYLEALRALIGAYQSVNRVDLAIDTARDYLHADPKSTAAVGVRVQLAEAYFWAGRIQEAKSTCWDLLKTPDLSPDFLARTLIVQARIEAHKKDWKSAFGKLDAIPAAQAALPKIRDTLEPLRFSIGIQECLAPKAPKSRGEDASIAFYQTRLSCMRNLLAGHTDKNLGVAKTQWCEAFLNTQKEYRTRKLNAYTVAQFEGEVKKTLNLATGFPCARAAESLTPPEAP